MDYTGQWSGCIKETMEQYLFSIEFDECYTICEFSFYNAKNSNHQLGKVYGFTTDYKLYDNYLLFSVREGDVKISDEPCVSLIENNVKDYRSGFDLLFEYDSDSNLSFSLMKDDNLIFDHYILFDNRCGDESTIDFKTVSFLELCRIYNFNKLDDKNLYFYRGQNRNFPLRTAFHRNKRTCFSTFFNDDFSLLREKIIASDGIEKDKLGPELVNLMILFKAQHFGYKTPLLDFSSNLYVALYFAISEWLKKPNFENLPVIFSMWKKGEGLHQGIKGNFFYSCLPNCFVFNPYRYHNERALNQEGVCLLSNVDNIESISTHFEDDYNFQGFRLDKDAIVAAWEYLQESKITASFIYPGNEGVIKEVEDVRSFRIFKTSYC